jgi:hypothetical protein
MEKWKQKSDVKYSIINQQQVANQIWERGGMKYTCQNFIGSAQSEEVKALL